jgi:hypothetical protein
MTTVRRLPAAAAAVLICALLAAPAAAQEGASAAALPDHPHELPRLAPDGPFPRCTAADLAAAGYPDHMHEWRWHGWQTLVDASGTPYGPGAFCDRRQVLPREGLVVGENEQRWSWWVIRHNPAYHPCDMLGFMEVLDLAERRCTELLGLAPRDTLTIINPDNTGQYRDMGGVGTWRLLRREGAAVLLQPIGTLQARTLAGHAAFLLVSDWILASGLAEPPPAWLRWGLAEYLAEDGQHLLNYMVEFRGGGSPLLGPAEVERILGGDPDGDPARDREQFRRASYSAFLMAWELVENRGGLAALRAFLQAAAGGATLDDAARRVYGHDMTELARSLDPVELGEPVGDAVQARRPDVQP